MSRDIDIYAIEARILDATFTLLVVVVCAAQEIRRHLARPARKTQP